MYCISKYSINLCTEKTSKAHAQEGPGFYGNLHWFDPHLNKCF